MYVSYLQLKKYERFMRIAQESSGDKEGSAEEEKVTAKIKISGPEQIFAYTIHLINLVTITPDSIW